MRNNDIIPSDTSFSREHYGLNNTTDIYRGTSFKFSGKWMSNTHYFNDEYIIDFVSYDGALWACQKSHLSANNIPPSDTNTNWTKVITGVKGEVYVPHIDPVTKTLTFELKGEPSGPIRIADLKGDPGNDGSNGRDGRDGRDGINGKTYRPNPKLENGYLVFRSEDGDTIKVDASQLKGETGATGAKGADGKSWIFSRAIVTSLESYQNPTVNIRANTPGSSSTTYTLELGIPRGEKGERGNQGIKGDKGDKGNDAPCNEFKIEFDPDLGMSKLYSRPITDPESNWSYVGICGGLPGKSPKLIRVFDEANNPLHQNDTRRDDRILWGYDGVPVSEWTVLCTLDDIRGDENIHIGCEEPKMPDGITPNHDQIWYDPCDNDEGHWNSAEFLADVCEKVGGTLANVGSITGSNTVHLVTEAPAVGGFPRTSLHTTIDRTDKVLSVSQNGIKAQLSFDYNRTEGLKLMGKNNQTIATIPADDFIKDGMLQDVQVEDNNLIFIFNTDAGNKRISLSLEKFANTYLSGNGIDINKKIVNIKINPGSDQYLTVDRDGLLLSGVQDAINSKTTTEEVEQQIINKHYITLAEVPTINISDNDLPRTAIKNIIQYDRDNWGTERVEIPTRPSMVPLPNKAGGSVGTGKINSSDTRENYHEYAYSDHQHPTNFDLQGNAATATKLKTPVTLSLTGNVTGDSSFDGSTSISISTTVSTMDASAIKTGTIDIARLPKGALERMVVVANEAARFNLTTAQVQEGDTVKQNDTGVMYFVVDISNLNNANGYSEYTAAAATSVPWSGVTSKPTFATVATTGSYNNLIDKPTIPVVGYSESGNNLALRLATGNKGYITLSSAAIVSALGYTPANLDNVIIKGSNTASNQISISSSVASGYILNLNSTAQNKCEIGCGISGNVRGIFGVNATSTYMYESISKVYLSIQSNKQIRKQLSSYNYALAADLDVEIVTEVPSTIKAGKCYVCQTTRAPHITAFTYDTSSTQASEGSAMVICAVGAIFDNSSFYKNINIDTSASGYHVYCIQALIDSGIILVNGATYTN